MARYYSDMVHRRTCVYRLYDGDDTLLYVGLSMNLDGRLTAHRRREWWPVVTRCDVEWFEGREAAKKAEREAIASEKPLHNIVRPIAEQVTFRDITATGTGA